jgi:hypothetical protein
MNYYESRKQACRVGWYAFNNLPPKKVLCAVVEIAVVGSDAG